MNALQNVTNADAIASFVADAVFEKLPKEVLEAARFCLVDWFGVAIGSTDEQAIKAIKRVVQGWNATGKAPILLDGETSAAAAALVNGTMAHCLDFDDTHVGSIAHLTGPTWAAAFAVGAQTGASPRDIVAAFVSGFEVGGRLGSGGLGVAINERSIHSTGVFGCVGAAVAASILYGLNSDQLKNAIGLAATQAAGLTGSFGTTAKPFHAGKAAFNGVLAAEMAREGFNAATGLVEIDGGLAVALVQDRAVKVSSLDFSEGWEITRNTLKPYASCLLTHPVIDAARELHERRRDREIRKVDIRVDPMCIQLAGISNPKTPFEGKFSVAFCAALGLEGKIPSQTEFNSTTLGDRAIRHLVDVVELVPTAKMEKTAATVEILLADGTRESCHVPLARGNPGRPMSWSDMERKFTSLVEPVIPGKSRQLFECLKEFDTMQDLSKIIPVVTGKPVLN
jgi:2-methylcitrate dehydratase PrpD